MADVGVKVNTAEVRLKLRTLRERIRPERILKAVAPLMVGSVNQTFREEGSPSGSWPRLAASTLKRRRYLDKKILNQTNRLRGSIAAQVDGNRLRLGTNVIYARIHQLGGRAGRKLAARIPARPFLVFRPEDPDRIANIAANVVDQVIKEEGLD